MKTCRICDWIYTGPRCPFCYAWKDRLAALAAMENAEAMADPEFAAMVADDDQAMLDYHSERQAANTFWRS